MSRIHGYILYIAVNGIKLRALLVHNVRNVPKQLVQFAYTRLDIPDLGFPLHNQRFLEIHLVL